MDTREFTNSGIKQHIAQISTPTVTTTGTNSSLLSDDERLERFAQQPDSFESSAGSLSSQNRLQLTARSGNQTVTIKASACGVVPNTDGVEFSNLQAQCLLLSTSTSLMDTLSFTTIESNVRATGTQARHFKCDVASHNESNQSLDRDSRLPEPTQNGSRSRFLSLKRVDESPDSKFVLLSDSFQSTSIDPVALCNNLTVRNSESSHNDSAQPLSCAFKQRLISEMLLPDVECSELRVALDNDMHLNSARSLCDYHQTGALQNESPSNSNQKKHHPMSASAKFCSEKNERELEQGKRLCEESNDGAILPLNDTISASTNTTEKYKHLLDKLRDKRVLPTVCHGDHQLNEQSVQVNKKPTVKDSRCRTVQPRSKSAEAAVSSVLILPDPMPPGITTVGASDAYSQPNPELVSWKPNRKAPRTVQELQSTAEDRTVFVSNKHQSSSDATNADQKWTVAICVSAVEGKAKAVTEQTWQLMPVTDSIGKVEDALEQKLANNHSQESQPFCMSSSDIRVEGPKDINVIKQSEMLKFRASFEFLNNKSSTISAQEIMTSASQAEAFSNPEKNTSSEPDQILSRLQDVESKRPDPGVVASAEEVDLMKIEKQLVMEDTTSVSHEIISLPTMSISLGIGDSETPSTRQLSPVHRHAASSCRIRRSTKDQQQQHKDVNLHHNAAAERRVKQKQDRQPTKPSSRSAKASSKMQPDESHNSSSPPKQQRKASTNKQRYESTKHHSGLLATTVKVIASFKHRDQQQQLKRGDEAPSSVGRNSSGKQLAAVEKSKRKPGQRKGRDLSAQPAATKLESVGMRQSNNFADPKSTLELPRRSQSAWIPKASVQKAPLVLGKSSKPGPGREFFASDRKKTQVTAQHCVAGAYRPSREAFSAMLNDQNVSGSLTIRHKRLTSAPSINRKKLRCNSDIVPTVRHSSHARPAVRQSSQSTPPQNGIKNRLALRRDSIVPIIL